MVSTDAGKNFVPSNGGFSGRFVNTIMPDRETQAGFTRRQLTRPLGEGSFLLAAMEEPSWQPSMRNMPPRLIGYSILQDERDSNVIYLGTNLGM